MDHFSEIQKVAFEYILIMKVMSQLLENSTLPSDSLSSWITYLGGNDFLRQPGHHTLVLTLSSKVKTSL